MRKNDRPIKPYLVTVTNKVNGSQHFFTVLGKRLMDVNTMVKRNPLNRGDDITTTVEVM